MALSPTEEAQTRALIAQDAALLSLASNESAIISELGASDVTLADLSPAVSLSASDLFLVRQGATERSVQKSLLAPDLPVPIAQGGTGATTAAAARAALGAVSSTEDETIAGLKTFSDPPRVAPQSSGEGGELRLAKGTLSTLLSGTDVNIDIIENKIRFFESGGANRGAYITLSDCGASTGTNLLNFKFKAQYFVSSPTTLTAATHAGSLVTINGVAATLPLASTCPAGTLIQFYSAFAGSSVLRQGSDNITSNGSITSVSLAAGEAMMLVSDGLANWIMVNRYSGNQAWSDTFPTPTAFTGAFTSAFARVRWRKIDRQVYFTAQVDITTNGTAATYVQVPMPVPSFGGMRHTVAGRAFAVSGKALVGQIIGSNLIIRNYDNTYPGANAEVLDVGGVYEAAS